MDDLVKGPPEGSEPKRHKGRKERDKVGPTETEGEIRKGEGQGVEWSTDTLQSSEHFPVTA